MVKTSSTMLPLGSEAPNFSLQDTVSGKVISLSDFRSKKGLLVMFICNHCPFVQHIKDELTKIGHDYMDQDLGIVAISANDAENYPDDNPHLLKSFAINQKFNFPLCYDETQDVAKAYKAACTPDFFLFDNKLQLVYRGQLDNSRPGNEEPVDGGDLRSAIEAVLAGEPVSDQQKPSIGCNIKWKPGNEPDYFG